MKNYDEALKEVWQTKAGVLAEDLKEAKKTIDAAMFDIEAYKCRIAALEKSKNKLWIELQQEKQKSCWDRIKEKLWIK